MPEDFFSRTIVVLLRPKSPGNVGSVARAMKNMGFGRLVVADPIAYDDPGYFRAEADRMAWNASDLLDRLATVPTLEEALAPAAFVIGTTSRPPEGTRVLDPQAAARALAGMLESEPEASAAFLFGQEDIGLTRDQLARCHAIGVVPSAPAYPSLNLSQAALLFLYETRKDFLERGAATATAPRLHAPPLPRAAETGSAGETRPLHPTQDRLEALYARLEPALEEIGFLHGSSREHMMRELRRLLNRALLTDREVAMLEGIVRQIRWTARRTERSGS